ncbi:hypothetical protein [Allobaculum stercoricanis]|nr:hypothetical protein [Allobaculum stercoricanis]
MEKQITQLIDLFFLKLILKDMQKKKIKKALPMFDLHGSAY